MLYVNNLSFSYRKKPILSKLSLELSKGESIAVVGENGCGKSTLLSILAGVRKQDSGEILIDGQNPLRKRTIFTESIGYVPQDNPLIPELSVLDNLLLWYPGSKASLLAELENDLPAELKIGNYLKLQVRKLSGGMKRRVCLIMALLRNPPVLILDEPCTSLDLGSKEEIHQYLGFYLRKGGTLLFTTHDESDLNLCSSLYVLKNGTLEKIPKDLRGHSLVEHFH